MSDDGIIEADRTALRAIGAAMLGVTLLVFAAGAAVVVTYDVSAAYSVADTTILR